MATGPGTFYTLLDPNYFESLDRYRPTEEYTAPVEALLDSGWVVLRGGFWTNVLRRERSQLHEGWKIHISSTVENGEDILGRLAPILIGRGVNFKYCSDPRMLALSLTKNWPRTGAGKFMTVYPCAVEEFKELLEECHQATREFTGPYILSDRPYPGSRTVYYRYGEHAQRLRVNAYGNRVPTLLGTEGQIFSDDRVAYFRLPPWVEDPITSEPPPTPPGDDGIILNDRYRVKMAIKYSSVGGIYQATDLRTEEDVILREARPMLARVNTGYDAERLLRKEARILQTLGGTGLVPRFVDLFQQWEHTFLVQEKLEAESLWGYAMDFAFSDDSTPRSMFTQIRDTALEIAGGMQTVHDHGIILRDMTRTNVMMTEEGRVKFIDMEFAYEVGLNDPPVAGWTPGYASPDQLRNELPTYQDDYYALGVLFLDMISFTAPGYAINRHGMLRSLAMDLEDARQPGEVVDIILGLTALDAETRWSPRRAMEVFGSIEAPSDDRPIFPRGRRAPPRPRPPRTLVEEVARIVSGIVDFTRANADFSRHDRLWPASGEIFHTNPVHFQYGAAGTAYFLLSATGALEERELDWILDRTRRTVLPPGLHSGAAGVALLLHDAGATTDALELMARTRNLDAALELPNLYYGAAGRGIGCLGLWARTGKESLLREAVELGDRLVEAAVEDEQGFQWDCDGYVRLGYGEGQSGTALFLLYLYAATGHPKYRTIGVGALDFDLAHAVELDFGVLWYPHIEANPGDPKSPHIRFGTAGVGTSALRAWKITGEDRFRIWAERCAYSVSRRFTNKLWHDYGLAGYMELLLDMHAATDDETYLNSAWHLAERLAIHRLERPEGVAYLGRDLHRISCDYCMGSAGIGGVFERLLDPSKPRLLLPDQVLSAAALRTGAEPVDSRPVPAHA